MNAFSASILARSLSFGITLILVEKNDENVG
jgi:hypothetical protein